MKRQTLWLRASLMAFALVLFLGLPLSYRSIKVQADEPSAQLSAVERMRLLAKSDFLGEMLGEAAFLKSFNGVVLLAEKGQVLFAKAFGYSRLSDRTPMQLESVFQVASVSKTVTATAVTLLAQAGAIAVDTPMMVYIPDFPWPDITVRQVLNHRSGLPNYMYLADDRTNRRQPITNEDMHRLMVQYKPRLIFTPGARFDYSNTGYAYLALLVERVSGMPFEQFAYNKIFAPSGMESSYIFRAGSGKIIPNAVVGYKGGVPVNEDYNYLNGVVGDKGLYTTVADLLAFDRALHGGKLLQTPWLNLAFTGGSPEAKHMNYNYGFGFRIRKFDNGEEAIYHNGWWNGFKSAFRHYSKSDQTLIVLTNSDKKFPIPSIIEQVFVMGKANLDSAYAALDLVED